MSTHQSLKSIHSLARLGAGLVCLGLIVSCGPSSEDKLNAEIACSQYASSQSGYTPANPPGGSSSVGKGAAAGAVGGAAVGAVSSSGSSGKKTAKNAAIGAAAGAAAGAGLGALKDNEDQKKAAQARSAYQSEFQACMSAKGF